MKEIEFRSGIDDDEAVRLRHLRSNLCEVLRTRDANRNRQTKFHSHTASNDARDLGRRSEQVWGLCYVGERLIDEEPVGEGCVVSNDLARSTTEPLILLEMATHKKKLRAELP